MTDDLIYNAYLPNTSTQYGGDLPFFVGRQYGSGWLGTLARVAFPILKKIAGIASHAAEDVIYRDKPVKSAIVDNALGAINSFVQPQPPDSNSTSKTINRGSGFVRPSKRKNSSSFPLFQKKRKRIK